MEKTILIDGKDVPFKSTGAYLLRYKAQFGRDAMQDIYKLTEVMDEKTGEIIDVNKLDLGMFYDLIWTLAKTADKSIPEPLEWFDSFDHFPLMDVIPQVLDMIVSCLGSSVPSKKK